MVVFEYGHKTQWKRTRQTEIKGARTVMNALVINTQTAHNSRKFRLMTCFAYLLTYLLTYLHVCTSADSKTTPFNSEILTQKLNSVTCIRLNSEIPDR